MPKATLVLFVLALMLAYKGATADGDGIWWYTGAVIAGCGAVVSASSEDL